MCGVVWRPFCCLAQPAEGVSCVGNIVPRVPAADVLGSSVESLALSLYSSVCVAGAQTSTHTTVRRGVRSTGAPRGAIAGVHVGWLTGSSEGSTLSGLLPCTPTKSRTK